MELIALDDTAYLRQYVMVKWTPFTEGLDSDRIRYMIYGEEICPETGKWHLQCYIEFHAKIRYAGIKKLFKDKDIRLFQRSSNSTRLEARDYCKKDENFKEIGIWNKNGAGNRSDLDGITAQLLSGTRLKEVRRLNPAAYCRNRNGLKDIAMDYLEAKSEDFRHVKVTCYIGYTETGKSRKAIYTIPAEDRYILREWPWFDGYEGQKRLILDEYTGAIPYSMFLAVTDGHQLRLQVKGGHTYANWTEIIITSNLTPDLWVNEVRPEFIRRIKDIEWFDYNEGRLHWETIARRVLARGNLARGTELGNSELIQHLYSKDDREV